MAHWIELNTLLTDLSSEERDQLLNYTREKQSIFPFIQEHVKDTLFPEYPSPIVYKKIRVSQIQALIWLLQGKMHFSTVDPREGEFYREFTQNGRDGTLAPELTYHKAFWVEIQNQNLELVIDKELFDRHVPRLSNMLKVLRIPENRCRMDKFKEVTLDPHTGTHPIPHEIFDRILHIMNEV